MEKTLQINELINIKGKSAPDITGSLKSIGNGNMQDGLECISKFFYDSGKINGFKEGQIIGGIKAGITLILGLGGIYIVEKYKEYKLRKSLEERRNTIQKIITEENFIETEELSENDQ